MLITLQNHLKYRGDWNKDYGQVYVFYIARSQVTLIMANKIAAILDCTVYYHVHPLNSWFLIFNCSIKTYVITVSSENRLVSKHFFIEFLYALNYMVLNWLKKFITLSVNIILHHNLAQCVWLLYRELDTLLHLYYHELLVRVFS